MAKPMTWKAKRVTWKKGHLVSLRLRHNLYTIGQMLTSPAMRFYKVRSPDGIWKNIDLNHVEPLFQVFIGRIVLWRLCDGKIKEKSVKPSDAPDEPFWIRPHLYFGGGFPFRGGALIDLGPDGGIGTAVAPVIKLRLSLPVDKDIIERYELTNMWGPNDLSERLCHFFDTGKNYDPMKEKVFPELAHRQASR